MAKTRLVVKWLISSWAMSDLANDRKAMGETAYHEQRKAFCEMMRMYFETEKCTRRVSNINPIDGAPDGLKAFKLRWSRPGQGKSGGYRMLVVVDCAAQEAALQAAFLRRSDPSKAEYAKAAARGMVLTPLDASNEE
jgi:hypothetical protein